MKSALSLVLWVVAVILAALALGKYQGGTVTLEQFAFNTLSAIIGVGTLVILTGGAGLALAGRTRPPEPMDAALATALCTIASIALLYWAFVPPR
jgi:hypothetical protein